MTPEARLLRTLLSALGAGSPLPPLPLPDEIDWEDLLGLVRRHRLGALFHRQLPEAFSPPDPVRAEWEEEFRRQLAGAVLRGGCLRDLLEAFSRRGIEAIVLKGDHLGETYYPHPALRPAEDLDLLIRPADEAAAGEIVGRAGGKIQDRTVTAGKYLFPDTGVFLELHTDLQAAERRNPAFAIRIADFWAESHPARIAGAGARVLSPTLNLLYLAAHLSHHSFSRLIWFYDLYLVAAKSGPEIDWRALAERAGEYRCSVQVYYPLLFTAVLFGRSAPPEVLRRLAPGPFKRLLIRPFINPGAVLEAAIPESGFGARRNRFLLNDSWFLVLKNLYPR